MKNSMILPIYVLEKEKWQQPSHSYRQWQFCKECLIDLKEDLHIMGQPLIIRIGDVIDIFEVPLSSPFQAGLLSRSNFR